MNLKPLVLLLALPPLTAAAEPPTLDSILVTASRPTLAPLDLSRTEPIPARVDLADALATLPGAAVVRNGPLTGIAQVRGLTGDRVDILVDGMRITPACPNHMDPPLHYAGAADTDGLRLIAGTTPVSAGGDSLGAAIRVEARRPEFNDAAGWRTGARLGAGYSGANDGWNLAAAATLANADTALGYAGDLARADDLRFPGGRVRASGYELERHVFRFARATGAAGRLDATLGQHRTRDAGTPALPMDMVEDDAEWFNLGWRGRFDDTRVDARVYRHDIDHLMDNHSLRPNAGMKMNAPAQSRDTSAALAFDRRLGDGRLRYGGEWLRNDFDAYQWNASTGAFNQDILRDARRERAGAYGEWESSLGAWLVNLGLRTDQVRTRAGQVRFGPARALATSADGVAFNNADRDHRDLNWDWSVLLQYPASALTTYEIGLARKTRSPSLLERYEWSPLNASAGQADNNRYLGNRDLDPEVAHSLSAGIATRLGDHRLKATAFVRAVDDYIVGAPYAHASGNVLRYQNHDARFHGIDAEWRYETGAWHAAGVLGLTRARDRDAGDLHRVAPARLTLEIGHRTEAWQHTLRARLAARQDKVVRYDLPGLSNEPETPGHGVLDWHTSWQPGKNARVDFGIDNLLDKLYYDHLGGINRVAASDVAVGARLPGAGRFAFVQLEWKL